MTGASDGSEVESGCGDGDGCFSDKEDLAEADTAAAEIISSKWKEDGSKKPPSPLTEPSKTLLSPQKYDPFQISKKTAEVRIAAGLDERKICYDPRRHMATLPSKNAAP